METNNLFNNLIQRNQSAAFSSGKVRPNHETNINIIARRTGKDVNSHTVLDGIITTIMATIQRINIIGSLGQFSGRVQQTYKHSVPRFFVPEHGTMFTLALVRFPPTATKEIQYLNAKGALTYTDIAGDPVLYGNLPPREISMKDVFRSGDSSKK